MGWGKNLLRLLNTPIGFIEKVEDSEEYQRLKGAHEKLELIHRRLRGKEERLSRDQHNLVVENGRLQTKVRGLELEFRALSLGRHLLADSTMGVLVFDRDNKVVDANEAMCNYLQVERPELVGDSLNNLGSVVPYFNIYANFFGEIAKPTAINNGVEIKPNRFVINSVPFDIMGYATRAGTRGEPVYDGGFLTLTPFQEKSLIGKVFSKRSVVAAPEIPIDRENVADVFLELMNVQARHRYVDLAKSSMTEEALEALSKYYQCMINSEYTLTFRNVSAEERDYLIGLGVDTKHIRGVRKEEAESPEGLRSPIPEPAK